MKRYWFIFLSLLFIVGEAGASGRSGKGSKPLPLVSIHLVDRNGLSETISTKDRLTRFEDVCFLDPQPYEKVLRIYARDSRGNVRSVATTYYENGNPRQFLEILNGRANGRYCEWHQSGALHLLVQVVGGVPDLTPVAERSWVFDGVAQVWDETGALQAEMRYVKGSLEGISTYYHPSGIVWKRVPFEKNLVHGTAEVYRVTGELLQSTSYVNGAKEGTSLRYWEDGALAAKEEYACQGQLLTGYYFERGGAALGGVVDGHGMRVVFGKEHAQEYQEFVAGKLEGKVVCLASNGTKRRFYHVKNGVKHGEEVEFYPSSKPGQEVARLSFQWCQGKVQGVAKTWYSSGSLEAQKEMSNNKKQGLLSAWYRDGNVMMLEEYDKDRLVRGQYYARGEAQPISQVMKGEGTMTRFDADGHFIEKVTYKNGLPDKAP